MSSVKQRAFTKGGKTITYVAKVFADSPDTIHQFGGMRRCYGVQMTPPATVVQHAADIVSRNLIAHGLAEKMEALSGDATHPTVPIVGSYAVQDPNKPDGPIQLFMKKAPGKTASDSQNKLASCSKQQLGELVRQETWLQIQDFLLGQKDRHGDNLLCDFSGGAFTLKGIDNDACLDTRDSKPDDDGRVYDNTRELPPYIDGWMERAINGMGEGDLRELFEANGRDPQLPPFDVELQRCCSRLQRLKTHVNYCRRNSRILQNHHSWQKEEVFRALTGGNSYAVHHFQTLATAWQRLA
jgi:hypothetical protein